MRRLLGPMPDERVPRRAKCESRAMCSGVPPFLRSHRGRRGPRSWRPAVPIKSPGPSGLRADTRATGSRRLLFENRGTFEDARIRREHYEALSPSNRCCLRKENRRNVRRPKVRHGNVVFSWLLAWLARRLRSQDACACDKLCQTRRSSGDDQQHRIRPR